MAWAHARNLLRLFPEVEANKFTSYILELYLYGLRQTTETHAVTGCRQLRCERCEPDGSPGKIFQESISFGHVNV